MRERVFAHYLGNTAAAGAFRAALRIPNLLQNLFGEGVLSASFIPVYARLHQENRAEDAKRLAGTVFSLLLWVVSVIVLVGVAGSRYLIEVLAPGFEGETRELTIRMVEVMFPGTGLLVLSAWCLGILNSHRRFFLSYVAPVLWNVAIIVTLVVCGPRLLNGDWSTGRYVVAVAWGTVIGSALQFFIQLPFALRLNGGLSLILSLSFEPAKRVVTNFFPAVLTRGVVQLSAYLDQILSSFLGAQAVAAMAYAQTLYLLPISLFGMSLSASELPELSRMTASAEGMLAVEERLSRALRRLCFLVIPSVVALVVLGQVVVATLFETGRFSGQDSRFVWWILIGYAVGILATTQGRLCTSVFWALGDTRSPLRFALVRVLVSAGSGALAVFGLRERWGNEIGTVALAAAGGFSGWLEFVLIRWRLRQRIGSFGPGAGVHFKFWVAALISGALSFGLHCWLPPLLPWIHGGIILGAYGIGYLGLLYCLKDEEAVAVAGRLRRRLGR